MAKNGHCWSISVYYPCRGRSEGVARRIDKDLLQRIITCFMANVDYPEDLNLEIIHAMDYQSTGFDD